MSQVPEQPDLHKLFKVDDDHVEIRATLDRLGHYMRQQLEAGVPYVNFQIGRDVAALMASILIIDDPTV
jgi:hypothetical protein